MGTEAKVEIVVRGKIRRVFFCNSASPWMAGVLDDDEGGQVPFAGKIAAAVGDRLELTGSYVQDPKYGRQFRASTGLIKMDESPEALVHLLATDKRFKGLGPARAKAVVAAAMEFGGEMADALINHTVEIAARANVQVKIVADAATVWNLNRDYFNALAALCIQGWSNDRAQKIIEVYGLNAAAIVAKDPYVIIGKVARLGFKTVDAIALKLGTKACDPSRLAAGLAFCLDKAGNDGNTWTTRAELLALAEKELHPDTLNAEDLIRGVLEQMIAAGLVYIDKSPIGTEVVADARLARAEFDVFERLVEGLQDASLPPLRFDGPRAAAVMPTLNEGQTKALRGFGAFRIGVVSGKAGTGKTYVMKAIAEVCEENGLKVALCAPTGKAARKLEKSTERAARTVHRLLEPKFDEHTGEFKFTKGPGNKIRADVVILDEASMMDVRLMRSLLLAMGPGQCLIETEYGMQMVNVGPARLLIVGDHNQIPSVSPGAILRDLLSVRDKYAGAVTILDTVMRQAGQLAVNINAVLGGMVVQVESPVWGIKRTERGSESTAASMAAMLIEHVIMAPDAAIYEPFMRPLDFTWDVQVLSPKYKGELGVWALNVHLQKLRQRHLGNPAPPETEKDKAPKPLVGDRIIWTKNDYGLGLLNGTQARVVSFPKGGSMVIETEDGRDVEIPTEKRNRVEVAYAMTIHKSQGSEWPWVILVASSLHWFQHDRALFYTGASRASEALTILGDREGMQRFAHQLKSAQRQTFGSFLVQGWKPRDVLGAHAVQVDLVDAQLLVDVDDDAPKE